MDDDDKNIERKGLLEEVEMASGSPITTADDQEAAMTNPVPIEPTVLTLNRRRSEEEDDDDDEDERDLNYQADTVLTILKPVTITMVIVIWAVKSIEIKQSSAAGSVYRVYEETEGDSTGTKLLGSLLNALAMLVAIVISTVIIVILYKYRCYKVIYAWLIFASLNMLGMFGGTFFYYFLVANNWPFDMISFAFLLWNFSAVGILAVFWHAPAKINQGYLILISALLAIFFTRLPDWTTFAILAVISIYDLVAVLCPFGPLKILVETAQERQEPIPALLYNASVYMFMADREPAAAAAAPEQKKRKGVKLGLGDFIFYSVLIGRAALFNMMTVFTTFIGIVTGLFLTLLLLAIIRKALPALPSSIFLGMIFYFLTRIFLLPYIVAHSANQVFL